MGVKGRISAVLSTPRNQGERCGQSRTPVPTEGKGVTAGEISVAEDLFLFEGLRVMVRALVEDINRERGEDYLYFAEFAGVWLLLAKQKDKCDRRVDFGFSNAADLARVADTLQKALEGEIEI